MTDAESAPEITPDVAPPRVGAKIWWLGLGTSLFAASVMTIDAYAEGLPSVFLEIRNLDKLLHFGVAGMLAFFADGALRRRMVRLGPFTVPLAAVGLLTPIGLEELLQRFSVNRSSSFGDFAADVAGVAVFTWLSRRVDR